MTIRRRLAVAVLTALTVVTSSSVAGAGGTSPHPFDPLELPDVVRIKATARPGERPRFTWPESEDAVEYSLVVQDLKGRPYWAWRGPETTVYLGGVEQPAADSVGPRLAKRAQWQVTGYGPDGGIVAASPWKAVAARGAAVADARGER